MLELPVIKSATFLSAANSTKLFKIVVGFFGRGLAGYRGKKNAFHGITESWISVMF